MEREGGAGVETPARSISDCIRLQCARFCRTNRRCHDLTHTLCRSTACGVLWASSREETGLHVFVTAAVRAAETALAGALSHNEV